MSIRTDQVSSVLQRAISQVLAKEISDPRIVGMVSITKVDVSPDMANAGVYVSILPAQYEKRTLAGLRHATTHIRNRVLKNVRLRQVPRLEFKLDTSLKKQAEVLADIGEAVAREEQTQAQPHALPDNPFDPPVPPSDSPAPPAPSSPNT